MALTDQEKQIVRMMVFTRDVDYAAQIAADDDFARVEMDLYRIKRLAELAVDTQINMQQAADILAEQQLLN